MSSENQNPALCPDWVFSDNSSTHDINWFIEYTPFRSVVCSFVGDSTARVLGVGTVGLPVQKSPGGEHSVFLLTNVLHIPSLLVNIIGGLWTGDYADVTVGRQRGSKGGFWDDQGRQLAHFKSDSEMLTVQLTPPPFGPRVVLSQLAPGVLYTLRVMWPDGEWQRWEAHRALTTPNQMTGTAPTDMAGMEGITPDEKQWLKKHYNDEFKFLLAYGLSIYKEEDRAEGRAILRALMSQSEG